MNLRTQNNSKYFLGNYQRIYFESRYGPIETIRGNGK